MVRGIRRRASFGLVLGWVLAAVSAEAGDVDRYDPPRGLRWGQSIETINALLKSDGGSALKGREIKDAGKPTGWFVAVPRVDWDIQDRPTQYDLLLDRDKHLGAVRARIFRTINNFTNSDITNYLDRSDYVRQQKLNAQDNTKTRHDFTTAWAEIHEGLTLKYGPADEPHPSITVPDLITDREWVDGQHAVWKASDGSRIELVPVYNATVASGSAWHYIDIVIVYSTAAYEAASHTTAMNEF